MEPLVLFIKTTAKPGKRDDVYALWATYVRPHREGDSTQNATFCCFDNHDPNVMYTLEYYTDRADFDASAQEPWFTEYIKSISPLLAAPPEVGFTTPIWIKPASCTS